MSSIVSRFKVLALTVLALCGLTALMATSAQANWLENGAAIAVNKSVLAKAHTVIKFLITTLNLEIRCTALDGEDILLITGTLEATGKVKFLGCEGFQISNGALQKNCEPFDGTEKGVILLGGRALNVLLALTKGGTLRNLVLFEPAAGSTSFGLILLPETCALAETSEITGSVVAECGLLNGSSVFVGEECSVAQRVHLLQAIPQTEFFNGTKDEVKVEDKLKFGENKLLIDGIAAVELASGNPWAGDA